ncbi:MAG: hypothetical protein KF756_03795 [Acidobacteria bacterium]|nr:hypothetical protein [Acidobacteriota bacterium]
MDAYYLLDPYNGINIGQKIIHGPESQFLVTLGHPNGLNQGLSDLAALTAKFGKKRRLEIHCHGLAGAIDLGGDRSVSNHNVRGFGIALKAALLPGGLIEVLACLVASQEGEGSLLTAPISRIEGYREDYHGAIRLIRTRDYDREARFMPSAEVGADGKVQYGASKWGMGRTRLPHYGGRFTPREKPLVDDPLGFFRPAFEHDGLRFCLELASSSGCTVRAAVRSQIEEGTLTGYERLHSPIGNWEFEVFDFQPDGHIQFLGSSPFRGPINSFDMVQRVPAV